MSISFEEIARKRFSSRNYLNKPIEKEKIEKIIEAARIAPSAANKQPYIFFVISKQEMLEKIYNTYHREWFKNAPIVIVGCAKYDEAWVRQFDNKNHADIDIAIAIDHMTLQAADVGLATCWICNFDINKCQEILSLPPNIIPIVLLPLAYPADVPPSDRYEKRKKIQDIVKWL